MSTYLAFKSFCFVLSIFGECLLIWLSSRSVLFWAYLVNVYLFGFQIVLFCFEHIWWMSTYLAFKSFCSVWAYLVNIYLFGFQVVLFCLSIFGECLLIWLSSRSVLYWAYLVNVYLFGFQVVLFCFDHIWWMSTYLAFRSFCSVLSIFGECLLIWLSSRSVLFWTYLVNVYLFGFQVVLFCFEHIWWMSTY